MKKKLAPKIETLEEFLARGGEIKKVGYENAHGKFINFGRNFKDMRKHMISKVEVNKQIKSRRDGKNILCADRAEILKERK